MQRPWNLPNLPVYSLATYWDGTVNLNICTYVSAVSMQPKLYMIAIYNHTETLQRMQQTNEAVLQLLNAQQHYLVRPLGKKSGSTFSKQQWLEKKYLLTAWNNLTVLKEAAAYVHLQKINTITTSGDHVLFLFKVLHAKSCSRNILTTEILAQKKIITI
ncbi:flavin reductase family protein [Hydrotalea sp.]|uniref:flavin reductase family protein n=1 Tax=Hydrotalea sp. TaxID=2881279 RepID=UPI003D0BC763